MGRPMYEIDLDKMEELGMRGSDQGTMAGELGISKPTLSKVIARIKDKQGILLKYRELQPLQLTAIQARILEHITPEKIAEAPLRDLVLAFKILKDKELVIDGKPSEIKGLVGYLVELEKKEMSGVTGDITEAEFEEASQAAAEAMEASPQAIFDINNPDYLPKLQ